jgi:hypothetical protein
MRAYVAVARSLRHLRVRSIGLGLFYAGSLLSGHAAHPANSPDETFLDRLQGRWVMTGTLGGKPVRYRADGQRVLQGRFLRLHMIDAASPPQYEADVFIGFDPNAHDYIAHWLDRFGAAGSRVVAQGKRSGEQLVIAFPYADGAFRDTFIWRPATESWSLLLESQATDGTWSTFASYTLTRRGARSPASIPGSKSSVVP